MNDIQNKINRTIRNIYKDFIGSYLFGSSLKRSEFEDVDIILLFGELNRVKILDIHGILSKIEYEEEVFLDAKIYTQEQFHYNPYFYDEVIKTGSYCAA